MKHLLNESIRIANWRVSGSAKGTYVVRRRLSTPTVSANETMVFNNVTRGVARRWCPGAGSSPLREIWSVTESNNFSNLEIPDSDVSRHSWYTVCHSLLKQPSRQNTSITTWSGAILRPTEDHSRSTGRFFRGFSACQS